MTRFRLAWGPAIACALLAGPFAFLSEVEAGVRVWGPGQSSASNTSSIRVWSAPVDKAAVVPAGADDEAPDEAKAGQPEPVAEKSQDRIRPREYSVTTVTPSYRYYRLRRALGQRYTGFKKQYRGQRYLGFKRLSRVRKYNVQQAKVKVIPAEKRVIVINRLPVPFRYRPGPVAVVPAHTDLP
ncbi:MAG: hypothetical protein AAF441_04695 [Pseudomonadota bacterium]